MALIQHAWAGEPHESVSIKYVDSVEVARNPIIPPRSANPGWVTGVYADVTISSGTAIATTTQEASSSVLPRIQRVYISQGAIPVSAGSEFHLRAEVRHSRGMPMHISAWFLTESGDNSGQRRGDNVLADGWQVAHLTDTAPASAAYMGWQVRVDSSTEAGPSYVGDVFEARHFAPFPDYFDGDTPDYYDNATPKVYTNNGWATLAPRFYI